MVFTKLSLLGFGGPNAHLALMLEEIVEKQRWISREHFLHLMAVTNLLPGPNSSEVAIHIGYTQRGWRGALLSGLCFVAPTFLIVVFLSHLYFAYGSLPAVEEILWGVKPVIVAIILGAGFKLARAAITDAKLIAVALTGVLTTIFLPGREIGVMMLAAVLAVVIYRERRDARPPGERNGAPPGPRQEGVEEKKSIFLPIIAGAIITGGSLGQIFWLMLWIGSVLFGGGYMLVALLQPQVVDSLGWLSTGQFLDGIAITQAVPGPIVTLVAFVGYSVAGVAGAAVATIGIYLPSFAAVLAVAPHVDRWRQVGVVRAALKGVNAVVAGAILGAALILGHNAVTDVAAILLLAGALIAVVRFDIAATWIVLCGLLAGLVRYAL